MVYMKIPKESKIPKNKYGPYELGSDKHLHHLATHHDSKWRGNWPVGWCKLTGKCAGHPAACPGCLKFSAFKEKRG